MQVSFIAAGVVSFPVSFITGKADIRCNDLNRF
jgi:hypothetical protein